jgi:hypothetical protein
LNEFLQWGGLAALAANAWFWLDSLRARDIALGAARDACKADGVQLLDWTVALSRLRVGRNDDGQVRFLRVYDFEYSDTGDNRLHGSVTLLGRHVEALRLAPGRVTGSNVIPLRH